MAADTTTAAAAPEITGPACDICGQEPAAASLMFLGDYSQVKFGMDCAPGFLAQQLAAIDPGRAVPLVTDAVAAAAQEVADAMELAGQSEQPDSASLSESAVSGRPDPMTDNVVRSTHGHRRSRDDRS